MSSGSSLAFQRLSRDAIKFILGINERCSYCVYRPGWPHRAGWPGRARRPGRPGRGRRRDGTPRPSPGRGARGLGARCADVTQHSVRERNQEPGVRNRTESYGTVRNSTESYGT
eukprot:gene15866-biopygen20221